MGKTMGKTMVTFKAVGLSLGLLGFTVISPALATTVPQDLETCFSPEEKCDEKLIAFFATATRSIDLTLYNLTHRGIAKAIEDARARGVVVRAVVDQGQAVFQNSQIQRLNDQGFALRFATKISSYSLLHDKFSIVDGRMIETGSFNYTIAATRNNHENQLYISAAQVVSRYQAEFEKMYAEGTPIPAGFKSDQSFSDCPAATPTPRPAAGPVTSPAVP